MYFLSLYRCLVIPCFSEECDAPKFVGPNSLNARISGLQPLETTCSGTLLTYATCFSEVGLR